MARKNACSSNIVAPRRPAGLRKEPPLALVPEALSLMSLAPHHLDQKLKTSQDTGLSRTSCARRMKLSMILCLFFYATCCQCLVTRSYGLRRCTNAIIEDHIADSKIQSAMGAAR
eukprot:CAMPEP_0184479680 /NCGR_PEP_ID=MMETSP0113_2-20130426/1310_1 /TAXON_ID=91329 /ORGANISM="Norrisiella sphaerica, Strain BC52" /LENGTH=114 /DNA_ID=CAMNT_0026857807 /DNA_START=120 /DNA_END=460 /DNA_ORIENTATION=-